MTTTKLIRKGGTFKHKRLTFSHPCLESYIGKKIGIEEQNVQFRLTCFDLDTKNTICDAKEIHADEYYDSMQMLQRPEYFSKLCHGEFDS